MTDHTFMRQLLIAGVRYDGRGLTDVRPLLIKEGPDLFPSALQGLRFDVPDTNTALLLGINAEVCTVAEGTSVPSLIELEMKTTMNAGREKNDLLEEIAGIIRECFLDRLPAERLLLAPRAYWKLFVDVLVVGNLFLADIDSILVALHFALLRLEIPRVRVSYNLWRDEFVYETLEETVSLFARPEVPILRLVGEIGGQIVLDLHPDELQAVDSYYLLSADAQGNTLKVEGLSGRATDPHRTALVLKKLNEMAKILSQLNPFNPN